MNTLNQVLKEFKKRLSTKSLILRYISFKKRLFISSLIVLMLGLLVTSIGLNNKWILIPMLGVEIFLLFYLFQITKQIKSLKYGSLDEFQKLRYKLLIDILERHGLYHGNNQARTKEKLLLLLSLMNSKLTGNKKSIPVLGFFTTIVVTIFRFGIDHKFSAELYISITTLIIMLISIYLMFSPFIKEVMNRDRNKMEELRNMITEHLLKDIL